MRKLIISLLVLLGVNMFAWQVKAIDLPVPHLDENDPIVVKAKETFEIAKKAGYDDAVAESKVLSMKNKLEKLERDYSEKSGFDRSYEEQQIPLVKAEIAKLETARKPIHKKAVELQKIADEARAYTFVAFYDRSTQTLVPGTKIELCKSGLVNTLEFVREKLGDELANKYYLAKGQKNDLILQSDFDSVTVIELVPRTSLKRGQVAPTGEKLAYSVSGVGLLVVLLALLVKISRKSSKIA